MTDETLRSIEMSRLAKGRYVATNARGGRESQTLAHSGGAFVRTPGAT